MQTVVQFAHMEENQRLSLALEFVQTTGKNIFLTGKAGTGKTTFLHRLKQNTPKRMAVVAPTGVAAINAGGVTIHSFFQLPFGPIVPGDANNDQTNKFQSQTKHFRAEKIKLLKALELLVIDEISMVRADVLDGIDQTLRFYRDREKPFGGVQLLMIGDLHQLPPVVKDDDWQILRPYYPDLYFFNSHAYVKSAPVCIELTKIYRQSDEQFIGLLNSIRENKLDQSVLDRLNKRYIPQFTAGENESYITLTTHNHSAQGINLKHLGKLEKQSFKYKAIIKDDFPEYAYPTDSEIELKEGAQVMFVKNDPEKQFYNGKIGTVVALDENTITVKCKGEYRDIVVRPVEWQNIKYNIDEKTKEVKEEVIGLFSQFPLKLAWAITIHKSQGLTFEHVIIDANAAFAHGQVYVALSRCKTFEGMVLSSPISFNSVKTDRAVNNFNESVNAGVPCEDHLVPAKIAFQKMQMLELFEFSPIRHSLFRCNKIVEDHYTTVGDHILQSIQSLKKQAEEQIYPVSDTFRRQLTSLLQQEDKYPEENVLVQERISKGAVWFAEKLENLIFNELLKINTGDIDNKAVRSSLSEVVQKLKTDVTVKLSVLNCCKDKFNTLAYLKTKADAEIDGVAKEAAANTYSNKTARNIPNAGLYDTLRKWRDELAASYNVPVFQILAQKSLMEIVTTLPLNSAELQKIKGIGKTKVAKFGTELLGMIIDYCGSKGIKHNISAQISIDIPTKAEKKPTHQISFELFNSGKTVEDVATERNLSPSTIESHLSLFLASGELDIYKLMDKEKVNVITDYFRSEKPSSLKDAKLALGDDYSYSDLKFVKEWLKNES